MVHMTDCRYNPLIHRLSTSGKWPILHPAGINLGKKAEWVTQRLWSLHSLQDRMYPYSYRELNDDLLVVQKVV